jgi:hypothetical protein
MLHFLIRTGKINVFPLSEASLKAARNSLSTHSDFTEFGDRAIIKN